eukprot:TRINITY_DN1992_c0_g1_i2.p1 TRINITY_DN1992_c0_g1~~TRINITY_DN1992_c0_g1_i2.p1  ORF type:complete len:1050 (-),score=297.86 TRINITY_DN1992_c0_g1_i2:63-3212(-)
MSEDGTASDDNASGPHIILFITLNLMFGSAVRQAIKTFKIPIPYTAIIFVFGMCWGYLSRNPTTKLSSAATLMGQIDPAILLGLFLPALIYESAFSFNPYTFFKQFVPSLVLAVPGILVTIWFLAWIPIYVFGYEWSWNIALMFGAILSSTDPIAVSSLLREAGVSKRISSLVDGESLINDATAFLVFSILQDALNGITATPGFIIGFFLQLALGGALLGIVIGCLFCYWIVRTYNDPIQETILTISAAYLTFWIAEFSTVIRVSGVISVVSLGITMSYYRSVITPEVEHQVEHVWNLIAFFANTLIFSISGVIVVHKVFSDHIEAIDFVWAIVMFILMNVGRALMVVLFSPILIKFGYGIDFKAGVVLCHSGLRGAVSLALAMISELQHDIDDVTKARLTFQVCVMVFLTLIINGLTAKPLLHVLKLDKAAPGSHMLFNEAMAAVKGKRRPLIEEMQIGNQYAGANWELVKSFLPSYKKVQKELGEERGVKEFADSRRTSSGNSAIADKQQSRRDSGVEGVIETEDDLLVLFEVNRRLLMAMNASYAKQYEERQISRRTFIALRGAIEKGLLTDDAKAHWKAVKQDHLRTSPLIQHYYSNKNSWISWIVEVFVKRELTSRYEVAGAFLKATRTFDKVLSVLPKYRKRPSIRSLKKSMREFRRQATFLLLDIEKSFPELYEEIQTRQAAALMLFNEKQEILRLHSEQGVLEEKELMKIMLKLDRRLHDLSQRNPLATQGLKKIPLSSLPLIEKIRDVDLKRRVVDSLERKLFHAGEFVVRKGSTSSGLLLVVRGMAAKRIADRVVECIGSGSIIECWCSVCPTEKYFTDVRAETYLEVAFLKLENMSMLLSIPEIVGELWCVAASDILKMYFTDYFHGMDPSEVNRLCALSSLIQTFTTAPADPMTFPDGGLLLGGSLTIDSIHASADEEDDDSKELSLSLPMVGATYEKPLLILPRSGSYRLGPDSRVLKFASGIWVSSKQGFGVVRPEDLQSYMDKHSPPAVLLGGFDKAMIEEQDDLMFEFEESKSSQSAGMRPNLKMSAMSVKKV